MDTENKIEKDWQKDARSIIAMGKFLEHMRENSKRPDLAKKIYADYGIGESSISRLIKIAKHPVLSNPEYAEKLPPSWAILYELRFLPDDLLLEKIQDGSLQRASKYDVWALRGVKVQRKNGPSKNKGSQVRVPAHLSVVDFVRSGMEKEDEFNGDIETAARHIGLGAQTYRMIRALIILSERPELSVTDKEKVLSLMEKVNRTRNVRKYFGEAKPLMDQIWGNQRNKKFTEKDSQKRVEAYLNSVFLIGMSSQRLLDQEIPYMSISDTDRTIGELAEAGKTIRKVAENLRRLKHG